MTRIIGSDTRVVPLRLTLADSYAKQTPISQCIRERMYQTISSGEIPFLVQRTSSLFFVFCTPLMMIKPLPVIISGNDIGILDDAILWIESSRPWSCFMRNSKCQQFPFLTRHEFGSLTVDLLADLLVSACATCATCANPATRARCHHLKDLFPSLRMRSEK